jgi:hypothetical protein
MAFGPRWMAAAVCVSLLAVGGCSDDEPEPNFAPSSSPSPTRSSSPAPEAWEVKSEDGAVAFARHWVDVFNDAQESGETSTLRAISTDSCVSCDGFAGQLEDLYNGGGTLDSDGWAVVHSVPTADVPNNEAIVALRINRSPQVIQQADGKEQRFAGGRATYSARLVWRANAWLMNELELLQ